MSAEDVARSSDAVARSFVEESPAGWVSAELVYLELGKTGEMRAFTTGPDGRTVRVKMPMSTVDAFDSLRAAMFRPGEGAWFTATCRISAERRVSFNFDFDSEPAFSSEISLGHVLEEMQTYPRDDAHTPVWLADRLVAAREWEQRV
ncbi:hypothetical protein [Cellulomonas marina]|uniref:hypothetical protein n=1 Tax=Cellulomonas marina TaxID=988821 RepID=UPI001113CAD9|nr:hypothetical protein [Cellulomonas marina]